MSPSWEKFATEDRLPSLRIPPLVAHQLASAYNFFGRKPVLMLVEPESLCWLTGRMVKARDGATWAEEFARFPALTAVVRDDGTGLGKGLKLERADVAPRIKATSTTGWISFTRSAKEAAP